MGVNDASTMLVIIRHFLENYFQFNYYEGTIDRGLGVREKSEANCRNVG
jgi:hypothetical protein